MKTTLAVIALITLFCTGCLTPASNINVISIGMSKTEVLRIMGTPASVTADTSGEYLNYALAEGSTSPAAALTPYEIKIVDGKVVSYGRAGNTATTPTRPVPIIMPMPVVR